MTAITVDSVGKRYVKYVDTPLLLHRALRFRAATQRSHLWAVRGVSFEVEPGECVGVIGRNGSGKSTVLRLLAGVTAPTEGRVAVAGRIAPLISVGVGFHPELSGRENVYVNGTILGLGRREIEQRFDEIVGFAEVESFIDTPVKFYSSGMQVRLGFSVSVLAEPDVLLIDEVLAVGDIAFQLKCFDRLQEIRATGTTIVLVSHNLNAVRRMCDRTIVLHDGTLRHNGSTHDAISLFHDLLGEPRENDDGVDQLARDGTHLDERMVSDGCRILGPGGERTNHVEVGDEVTVHADYRVVADVENPVFGVSVLNEAGVQVYGDSTPWDARRSFPAGSTVQTAIRLRAALATGSYTVQVTVVRTDGSLLARVSRPALFYVHGRSRVRGVADLGARFDVATET